MQRRKPSPWLALAGAGLFACGFAVANRFQLTNGVLYRWDLATNTLSQGVRLNTGLGQAYTPTLVGADGGVYAISNATLYAIRES